ncbi:MAG: Gfo/Idh/MocA family oxidoreductase, partial [Fusobacterium sp.]
MLNLGVIGLGRIGKVHIESITTRVRGAKVKAVAEPFLNDEGREFAKKHGIENIYTDYKEILKDKEIDAVVICSSTNTHANISKEAALAGKHVFCEKPIDHD